MYECGLLTQTPLAYRSCTIWGPRKRTIPKNISTTKPSASTGSGTRGWWSVSTPTPTTTSTYRCSRTPASDPWGRGTWQKPWIQVALLSWWWMTKSNILHCMDCWDDFARLYLYFFNSFILVCGLGFNFPETLVVNVKHNKGRKLLCL